MNEQQPQQRTPDYGSNLARMFGYVTPEDRQRWEDQRQRGGVFTALKQGVAEVTNTIVDFAERDATAQLNAAHYVEAQDGDENIASSDGPLPRAMSSSRRRFLPTHIPAEPVYDTDLEL